jgi:2-oxo-4-hydroxy-4-carboxy-5-ureidoimidazoline decarboxylase
MDHAPTITIGTLNALDQAAFTAVLGGLFEHSPWIAARVALHAPFASERALHGAFMYVVYGLTQPEQIALIRAHPELAGQEAADNQLTESSATEQSRLGFTALASGEHSALAALNERYRRQFDFPCIIALTQHSSREGVYEEFRARLRNDPATERAAAMEAIGHITRARLARLLHPASSN